MTRLGILLATDGSTDAERAVELVASSFDPAETGTIEVLAVVPRVAEPLGHGPDEPPITLMEGEWQRAAQEVVERTSVRLAEAGHARVGMVRWGHPAETIVTRAGEAGTQPGRARDARLERLEAAPDRERFCEGGSVCTRLSARGPLRWAGAPRPVGLRCLAGRRRGPGTSRDAALARVDRGHGLHQL